MFMNISSSTCEKACLLLFFLESFNLWHPLLMITLYHQTKTPISFWCRRGLNPKSLIQLSETLPIELTWNPQLVCYLFSNSSLSLGFTIKRANLKHNNVLQILTSRPPAPPHRHPKLIDH